MIPTSVGSSGKMKSKFYQQNQRKGIGAVVNDAGYEVMFGIDLEGKRVLEIGAELSTPQILDGGKEYILADAHDGMMEQAKAKLDSLGIPYGLSRWKETPH